MPRDTAGLGSSPFARRYWGNRCYFLFLRVLRCFSSPRSPPGKPGVAGSLPPGCPIRKSASLGIFAPRRGFSQLVTSFFASESLGIPHAPLLRSVFPSRNTPGLQGRRILCLYLCSPPPSVTGGGARLLYSFLFALSLRPELHILALSPRFHDVNVLFPCVENNGVEPLTLCVQSRCSSQLS